MAITLYHHPYTRAANVVWMLEEVGEPYTLHWVDIMKGEQKSPAITALNPMGKLPLLTDGDAVVSESAAIALYLADRYAPGKLAPKLDDPARGTYLRWTVFAPSVIEPGSMAKQQNWEFKPVAAGWGDHETMLKTIEGAVTGRDYVLGKQFSMADVVFGGTLAFMMRFKMLDAGPAVKAYTERICARPAFQRSQEKNQSVAAEHGLKMG